MSNLLKDASILLTPTAYDNGSMLSVKPTDGDGDFTFSRNSAATRVNAQGLVENVQILSGDLVQNGDFSEEGAEEVTNGNFSQEGAELITNGDFATDSDWAKASGTTISDGKLNITANSTNDRTFQNVGIVEGKIYKLVLEVSNYQSGSLFILFGGSSTPNIPNITSNGTYTFYQECTGTNGYFYFGGNLFVGSIDNVSVKEVGQDWNLDDWTVADGKASIINGSSFITQSNILEVGKTYKIQYTISDYTSGLVRFRASFVNGTTNSSNGTYTDYITVASTTFGIQGYNNFTGSISNISAKEVGQDWSFGDGFTPDQANSKATCDGTQSAVTNLTQTISTNIQNKLVRVSFTLDYTAGVLLGSLSGTGAVDFNNITSSGTYTAEMTSNEVSPQLILQGDANFIGSITNIVIKEITNDTNLPRINYENGCGSWLLEDESTNLVPYSEDFSQWTLSGTISRESGYLSPDGTNNAYKINGSTSSRIQRTTSGLTVGEQYTFSIYLRADAAMDIGIGGIVSATPDVSITTEWKRYEVTQIATSTTRYPQVQYTGDLGNVYIWGAQLEQQTYATSYIPTQGATSTRLQDLATDSGNSTLINSTEGTLYAEIARNANEGSSPGIQINDGSSNNNLRLFFNQANTISVITRVGGSNNVVKTAQAITSSTAMNKFALVYKLNDYKLYYNGAELWNDTSASVYPVGTLNNLDFLNQTTPFKGEVKAVAVFKEALTDAQLTCLTKEDLDGTSFITTWRTTTSNETITIPTTGGGYNYSITTSDGQTFNGVSGNQTITFASAGDYDVSISGDFPRIYFNNVGDKTKLIDIKQWGNIVWSSFANAFFGCSNLTGSYTDAPNLTNVTSLYLTFSDAINFNGDTSFWDTSNVTTMFGTFYQASSFNKPLNNWNTSNVTNMFGMFWGATIFNQDVYSWDVSNVTNMDRMFHLTAFNKPLNNWNVSNVVNMFRIFNLSPFDHPLNSWDVSNVTNMGEMFKNSSFDHPLNNWDVSKVTKMNNMFNQSPFNQDIGSWDVSNVTNMFGMFYLDNSFNQDISDWDITSVTDFRFFATSVTFSTTNYDAILIGWEATLQATFPNGSGYTPNISINFGGSEYTGGGAAATARASLVSNFGWSIVDGGIA